MSKEISLAKVIWFVRIRGKKIPQSTCFFQSLVSEQRVALSTVLISSHRAKFVTHTQTRPEIESKFGVFRLVKQNPIVHQNLRPIRSKAPLNRLSPTRI